jgi:predicted anti-sigma-YlaC factor YlaD
MTRNATKMSCAEFQTQLSDLISSGATTANDPHLKTCENCRALLRDLETIAEAARQLFPIEEPPEALWQQIETAIGQDKTASQRR